MSREFIVSDHTLCIGCGICELACSGFKEKSYNRSKSRIRVVSIGYTLNMAIACRLCEDPACVRACPRKALTEDEETGRIDVDEDKCNGCAWCVYACRYGLMFIDPHKNTCFTCDLCKDEPDGKQRCVEACARGALTKMTADALATRLRTRGIIKLLEEEVIIPTLPLEKKKP